MTVDTLTELTDRVAELERRVHETPDQRVAREEATFQAERATSAAAAQVSRKRNRLAGLDRDLARHESWLDWMNKTREALRGELAEATAALNVAGLDRHQVDAARGQVDALTDALLCLDTGDWRGPSGDLFERAQRDHVTLPGHLGFTQTLRLVEALRQARATAQGELDQLLATV